jgi:hypothetical protein
MIGKREAKQRGQRAGAAAASWVFDGNTTDETYARVARMILDGDPELYDVVHEPEWLSGEHAGESMNELLDLTGRERNQDKIDEIAQIYELAANDAFWRIVEKEIPSHVWKRVRKQASERKWDHGKRLARHNNELDRRRDSFGGNPSKLTRQDFQFIADVVKELAPLEGHVRTRNQVALAFANALGRTNPRFDKTRFLKACGVTDPFYLNQ